MQPNQLDNQPAPTPAPTPAPSGAPSPDLVKALEETPATEPTAPNRPEPATESKPKSSKLPWTCAIIMTILALAGIGFGVYTFMDSNNKSDTIFSLETKVKTLNETIDKLEGGTTDAPTEPEESRSSIINTDSLASTAPYIDTEKNYFYVPKWGLKFKIPDELINYGYSVDYDGAKSFGDKTGESVGFTAMLKTDNHAAQAAYYDSIENCTITSVQKYEGRLPENYHINGIVKSVGEDDLLIWNRISACEYGLHLEEVQEKIQTMFQNPEAITEND